MPIYNRITKMACLLNLLKACSAGVIRKNAKFLKWE